MYINNNFVFVQCYATNLSNREQMRRIKSVPSCASLYTMRSIALCVPYQISSPLSIQQILTLAIDSKLTISSLSNRVSSQNCLSSFLRPIFPILSMLKQSPYLLHVMLRTKFIFIHLEIIVQMVLFSYIIIAFVDNITQSNLKTKS